VEDEGGVGTSGAKKRRATASVVETVIGTQATVITHSCHRHTRPTTTPAATTTTTATIQATKERPRQETNETDTVGGVVVVLTILMVRVMDTGMAGTLVSSVLVAVVRRLAPRLLPPDACRYSTAPFCMDDCVCVPSKLPGTNSVLLLTTILNNNIISSSSSTVSTSSSRHIIFHRTVDDPVSRYEDGVCFFAYDETRRERCEALIFNTGSYDIHQSVQKPKGYSDFNTNPVYIITLSSFSICYD